MIGGGGCGGVCGARWGRRLRLVVPGGGRAEWLYVSVVGGRGPQEAVRGEICMETRGGARIRKRRGYPDICVKY